MTTEAPSPTLGNVVAELERMYDPRWARDWDAVGLVAGDPEQPVAKVLFAVDPTRDDADGRRNRVVAPACGGR